MARRKALDVAADVAQQTTRADQLARIPGQHRLTDPRTNPAVRPHADRLRDAQHRHALDAAHAQTLRRHRVADRRAGQAEAELEALRQARQASSPARSVLALHRGRSRFMTGSLVASVVLSAGSAMGVAALAAEMHAPRGAGYIAEVGLTLLTTTVILYRSHLAQHGGRVTGWQAAVLWALMIGPLLVSMAANLAGAGPVGVFCSVGAAAFSLLSYVIADASAAALHQQAARVTGDDEDRLHAVATGDGLFSVPVEAEVPNPAVQVPVLPWEVICSGTEPLWPMRDPNWNLMVHEVVEPRTEPEPQANLNHEPDVQETGPNLESAGQQGSEPAEPARKPEAEPRTPVLSDRAAAKAAEIRQVLNLITEHGEDAVKLDTVRNLLPHLSKTTAYHRLDDARTLWNQSTAAS